jgi:hypothetical protein
VAQTVAGDGADQDGDKMSDLELTKLCAEAMGWTFVPDGNLPNRGWKAAHYVQEGALVEWSFKYDPLHDDDQAMALVKKFRISTYPEVDFWWAHVEMQGDHTAGQTLNRAIVECVAKMQEAK